MALFSTSRLGISVNLPTGATNDILLVNTPAFPVGAVTFEYTKPSSLKITGIQKCAQLFLKVLLTTKGSDVIRPTLGTTFSTIATTSNLNNQQELSHLVESAVQDAASQCVNITAAIPDIASQLDRVTITDLTLTTDNVLRISVYMLTKAGEFGSISLPSPLLNTPVYNIQ